MFKNMQHARDQTPFDTYQTSNNKTLDRRLNGANIANNSVLFDVKSVVMLNHKPPASCMPCLSKRSITTSVLRIFLDICVFLVQKNQNLIKTVNDITFADSLSLLIKTSLTSFSLI